MTQYILALDQGTTSSRSILFDHAGQIVSAAQKSSTQIYPQPGWVEHDPEADLCHPNGYRQASLASSRRRR